MNTFTFTCTTLPAVNNDRAILVQMLCEHRITELEKWRAAVGYFSISPRRVLEMGDLSSLSTL